MNLEEHMDKLKELLLYAREIKDPVNYFMDNLSNNQELFDNSVEIKNPLLEVVIKKVFSSVFNEEKKIRNHKFMQVAKYNFVHGMFFVGEYMGAVGYFSNEKKGFLALISHRNLTYVHTIRFTVIDPDIRNLKLSMN